MTVWLVFLMAVQLSIVAIGGAATMLPELQRQAVEVHGWVPASMFGDLYALSQAAPGPNILVVTLVGWQAAGWAGALAATGGVLLPSSLLTWWVAGAWHRFRERPWRRVVQASLVPVTVGLIGAAAVLLVMTTTRDWVTGAVSLAVAAATVATRWHPLVLLAAGAAVGVLGLV